MELQPASPTLIDALRSGSGLDLPPPTSAAEVRPVTQRISMTRPVPSDSPKPGTLSDEVLIPDHRAGLTPAQSVEKKLTALLRGGAIPASHFRMAKLCRQR
jgi:hypothetical protein